MPDGHSFKEKRDQQLAQRLLPGYPWAIMEAKSTDPYALLVCASSEARHIAPALAALEADVDVIHTASVEGIHAALHNRSGLCRLLTFCTDVIIPADILDMIKVPGVNIHPGPPNFRGLYPGVHALYDGAKTFGATVHALAPKIDTGQLVATNSFEIPADCDRAQLDAMTWDAITSLIQRLGPALLDPRLDLPQSTESWSGPLLTRADFDALCQLPAHCTDAEFERRYRAIGEGPNHALTIDLFGHTFKLDNSHNPENITVGGQPHTG